MPIKKATAFTASDGSMHITVEAAQRHELVCIITPAIVSNTDELNEVKIAAVVNTIFERVDDLLAVLTTGPRSRPAARKAKGTTLPRRAAKAATPEQARKGFAAMHAAADEATHDKVVAGAD